MIASGNWKHFPWVLGVAAAPWCLGGRIPEAQSVVACLLGLGLVLCAVSRGSAPPPPPVPWWVWGVVVFLFAAPLVPVPGAVLAALSPGRAAMAREFPIDSPAPDSFGTLSCAPWRTLLRVWEMCLLLAGFILARRAAREEGFAPLLFKFLVASLVVLCAADLEFRRTGGKLLMGLWPDRTGHGAATFSNRNHFADWVCMAALFGTGAVLRHYTPMRGARGAHSTRRRSLGGGWALTGAGVIAAGAGFLVATGSRGGVLALIAGSLVWLLLVARRGRNRTRWLWVGLSALLVLIVASYSSDYLVSRLGESSFGFKLKIWAASFGMLPQFLWFGSGWGGFERVFSLRKAFGGGIVFLHAENEYIQFLFEAGLVGAIPFAAAGGRFLFRVWRHAWIARMPEPEFYFGALAAVSAFLFHSLTEFVWQLLSTALLAAVLLGWLAGSSVDPAKQESPPGMRRRVWVPGMLAGLALLLVGGVEGFASWQWASGYGRRETDLKDSVRLIEISLRWWPGALDRQLLGAREEARLAFSEGKLGEDGGTPEFRRIRGRLNRVLRGDPYNWQLRFERALFDLSYGGDAARARSETLETIRLNPLNAQIPLRFASAYLESDPEFAFELLRQASAHATDELPTVFDLAWRAVPDASRLWSLTPETRAGWLALGDFAAGHNLKPLAAEAYLRLRPSVPGPELAERFLRVGRPDLSISILGPAPRRPGDRLLLSRAYQAQGLWREAAGAAEAVWRQSLPRARFLQPHYAAEAALTVGELESQAPRSVEGAERAGEALALEAAPRSAAADLKRLHDLFPGSLRLHWLAFKTARDSGQWAKAAELAEQLAERVLAAEPARALSLLENEPPPAGGPPAAPATGHVPQNLLK